MRNNPENMQHRRHRPMYLAPPAARLQHLLANSNDSSQNDGIGYDDNRDSDSYIKDLRIPLFEQYAPDAFFFGCRFSIFGITTGTDADNDANHDTDTDADNDTDTDTDTA
eukprot:jgi/Psemu1/24452/gm1.24452_g